MPGAAHLAGYTAQKGSAAAARAWNNPREWAGADFIVGSGSDLPPELAAHVARLADGWLDVLDCWLIVPLLSPTGVACIDNPVFACCATAGKVNRHTTETTFLATLLRINPTDILFLQILCNSPDW